MAQRYTAAAATIALMTSIGTALTTANTQSEARSAIGAGTSSVTLPGTGVVVTLAGDAGTLDASGAPDGAVAMLVGGVPQWGAAASGATRDSIGPTVPTGDALHHWRLSGSGPWSDLGSGAATLTATGSTWLTDRPGVSIWRGGVGSGSSPATGDRLSATTTIASGSSLTLAMTVGARTSVGGAAPWGGNRWLMIAWNGSTSVRNLFCFFASDNGVVVSSGVAGSSTQTATITVDWTIPHRLVATHAQSTGAIVLYVDGVSRATTTDSGSRAALDRVDVGGTSGNAFSLATLASGVLGDAQVWTRALTATEVLADWEAARAAIGR